MDQLELDMNRLSSAVLNLVDGLMARDSVRQDSGAMRLLRAAIDEFASIGRVYESTVLSSDKSQPSCTPEPSRARGGSSPDGGQRQPASQPNEPRKTRQSDSSAFTIWPNPAGEIADSENWTEPAASHEVAPSSPYEAETSMAPADITNVFGNGWMDRPYLHTQSLQHTCMARSQDSLAVLLVRIGFDMVHQSLLHDFSNPDALWRAVFRYAVHRHSREELLYTCRWFLGPGSQEIFRLAGVTVTNGISINPGLSRELHPLLDLDTTTAVVGSNRGSSGTGAYPLMSAVDVEEYVLGGGTRYVFPGILEIQCRSLRSQQTCFLNPDVFFPSGQTRPEGEVEHLVGASADRSCVIHVSQDRLFRNLAKTSLCLSRGPTYQRDLVDGAITAAVCRWTV